MAPIVEKATTQSTNDDLRILAVQGAEHLSLVWAHQQLAGRGRHGRVWQSPPGNLYFSILIRRDAHAAPAHQLVILTALAIWETLAPLLPDSSGLKLKWPNDVILNGGKLTGALLETGGAWNANGPAWLIAGIGFNLRHAPPASDALYPPVSLTNLGIDPPEPSQLASALKLRFATELETLKVAGFEPMRQRYLQRAFRLGQEIRVGTTANKSDYLAGTYEGLDAEGNLILNTKDQGQKSIRAGDVLMAPDDQTK